MEKSFFKGSLIACLWSLLHFSSYSQDCATIKAAGLVYCSDDSSVELIAESSNGDCNTVEWFSSAAIDVPLSTGCDFTTPNLTGNIRYFVRDNSDQSQVETRNVGFGFVNANGALTNPDASYFNGNMRTLFTPQQDVRINTVEIQVADWNGANPAQIIVEINNYSLVPSVMSFVAIDLAPLGVAYTPNEVIQLPINFNFSQFNTYDISLQAGQGINLLGYRGMPNQNINYDSLFLPAIQILASGPDTSLTTTPERNGYGPFFNWNVQAEFGEGCPKKEVNVVQRCIEICDDNIDNDTDGEVDEACEVFSCDGRLLQSIGNQLFQMSIDPVEFELVQTFDFGINALAFNAVDGKTYAIIFDDQSPDNGKMVRIAGDGTFQVLDRLITKDGTLLNSGYAADIDKNGNYYFLDNDVDILYTFEVNTLVEVNSVPLVLPGPVADITYNPATGTLFGIASNVTPRELLEIDPLTGVITNYGPMTIRDDMGNPVNQVRNGAIGGIYFLPNGKIISYGSFVGNNSNQNDMILIDLPTYIATGDVTLVAADERTANSNDGASCPYTLLVEKTSNVLEIEPGEDIEYTITITNNTGFDISNAALLDSLQDDLTVQAIIRNQLPTPEIGTGVGTQRIELTNIVIPQGGTSELVFTARVNPKKQCQDSIINNQAKVFNLPASLGFEVLSDNPLTPAENDATPVTLIGDFKPDPPVLDLTTPLCENDSLFINATIPDPAYNPYIVWYHESNGYTSNQLSDTVFSATPVDAGVYSAYIDSAGCRSDTTPFTVVVNPLPVSSVDPIPNFCSGDTLSIGVSSDIAGSTFLWVNNTDSIIAPINVPSVQVFAQSIREYEVQVTSPEGCIDTATVSWNPAPVPDVTVSNDLELCIGESANLIASGADTYAWSPATELDNANSSTVITTPTADRTYIVTGTNIQGCSDSDTVEVLARIKPTLTPISDLQICEGESDVLATTGADSIYVWTSVPANGFTTITPSSIGVSPNINTSYQVIGTNTFGCTDTVVALVVVNTVPDLVISDDTLRYCNGESETVTVSGADSLYTWSPTTDISSTSAPTVTISTGDDLTTYTVIGFNVGGCSDTAEVVTSVLDNPIPDVQILKNADICAGEDVVFDVVSDQYLGDAPVYRWFNIISGTRVQYLENTSVLSLPNLTESVEILLEVESNEICVDPANVVAISNTDLVTVNQFPRLQVSGSNDLCVENPVTLTVLDNAGVITTGFVWTNETNGGSVQYPETGDVLDLGVLGSSQTIQVQADNEGCTDAVSVTLDFVQVDVEISASKPTVFLGDGVDLTVFTDLDTDSLSGTPLNWDINQPPTRRLTDYPTDTVVYYVTAYKRGCVDTDSVIVYVLDGLKAPYFFSPNDDDYNDVWIVTELDGYNNTKINIFNRWGTKIIELEDGVNTWDGTNGSGREVPDGVYFYVIEGEAGGRELSLTGYVTIVR